ncbi:hypothetical protein [Deinococcus sp. SL84]|uniref:hypothetical protein n=1 Tax=Deinococcus sp. SL84 TaxID=2994663 RepID=UPI002272777C|nr:hypothetical protein [Deinococcus sp. SL84]MCY1703934.1 hypothetical protein [Deinococcus sp. SL84]
MSIDQALHQLQQLIQQFEAARPHTAPSLRSDHDKRLKKLRLELSRLKDYDPEIDIETPEELSASALGVIRRLQVHLPKIDDTESLTLYLPAHVDSKPTVQVHWDGVCWTILPRHLAINDVSMLTEHLHGQTAQTNDLDLWRFSLMPGEIATPELRRQQFLLGGKG